MRFPRKRRKPRVLRWEGYVQDLDKESVWIMFVPVHCEGLELMAEFPLWRLPQARAGMYITMYLHRKGNKRRFLLREKVFRERTPEELAEIKARSALWMDETKYWLDNDLGRAV